MKLLFLLFAITISVSLNAQNKVVHSTGVPKSPTGKTLKKANYTLTIIPSENKTWGYDIYVEKRLYIHQPCVPALPGNEGFKTQGDAEKIARLVIEKLKKGELPPSVSIEEMKKLKVLYTKK